jgi:hypothetical protein
MFKICYYQKDFKVIGAMVEENDIEVILMKFSWMHSISSIMLLLSVKKLFEVIIWKPFHL